MPKFIFEKLVRDGVLQRCLDDPKVRTEYRFLQGMERKEKLVSKAHEEIDEIPIIPNANPSVIEEIVDSLDSIEALQDEYGISDEQIADARRAKLEKNGSFALYAYIVSVDLDEDSEWVEIFRRDPEKFKEVKDE